MAAFIISSQNSTERGKNTSIRGVLEWTKTVFDEVDRFGEAATATFLKKL